MSQDGLAAFEPAFADELGVIMQWALAYLQKDGESDPDERTWLRDETGGSVYLRLTTNPIEQPGKRVDEDFRQGAIDGAYWLRKPKLFLHSEFLIVLYATSPGSRPQICLRSLDSYALHHKTQS